MHILTIIASFVFYILLVAPSHAKNPVRKCFEENDKNLAISACLDLAYSRIESLRNEVEHELSSMIRNDIYIKPPQIVDLNSKVVDPLQSEDSIEHAIKKAQNKIELQKYKTSLIKRKQYDKEKTVLVNKVLETRGMFEQYRKSECEIQRERFKPDIQTQDIMHKVCLYRMTAERIRTLEHSAGIERSNKQNTAK